MSAIRMPLLHRSRVGTPEGEATAIAVTTWGHDRWKWVWVRYDDGRERAWRPYQVQFTRRIPRSFR